MDFKTELEKWMQGVIRSYDYKGNGLAADTYAMIRDIDKIIAKAFDHDTVVEWQ